MSRVKGMIFDLDGTLLDTLADIAACMNAALTEHDLPTYAIEEYPWIIGGGLRQMIAGTVPQDRRSNALTDALVESFGRHYYAHGTDLTRPYDGVVESIARLREAGVKLAVLSNKPDHFTRELTELLLPAGDFVAVLGHREPFPTKPAPDSALYIVEQMDLQPSDVAYVGDSDVDILTAKNAGLVAIGAGWGFRGADELREAGADYIAMSMRELTEWTLG